jgi:hypothetical protein
MSIIVYLLISLVVLGLISAGSSLLLRRRGHDEAPFIPDASDSCATCTGFNDKCEQDCMLEAATKPIEYFDDEELDAFKGRPSNLYTDEEVEQFAEVLESLHPEEVAAWGRSLHLRGIELPDILKDEYVAMMK